MSPARGSSRASARVTVSRVYDDDRADYCVLVDRLWPRGFKKDELTFDEWAKDLAPSTELRRWYGHEPERFREFTRRYRAELRAPAAHQALERLAAVARKRPVTLLTATKDVDRSAAHVLAGALSALLDH